MFRDILSDEDICVLSQYTDDEILNEMDAYKENMTVHPALTKFNIRQMRIFIAHRKELSGKEEKEYGT